MTLRARIPALAALALAAACRATAPPAPAPNGTENVAALYDPARDLGPLFGDVQVARVYPDGKTFVDARPLRPPAEIAARYLAARTASGFALRAFVDSQFAAPGMAGLPAGGDSAVARGGTMEEHIRALWPILTHEPDRPDPRSTLIPLPYVYVVPGGRFREVYYWDSYFTMLGLVESDRVETVRSMLDNFASLVVRVGHVPNGNRTYYLGRSQPPFFAAMVGLYAQAADTARALRYLGVLEREHAFWMDGARRLRPGTAYRRVVRLPNGAVLNRYWDDVPAPRPESYREDYSIGQSLPAAQRERFYRNARAGAESGWDYSSRWMRDPRDLRTLEVVDLAPVDLNTLLYHAERTIAALRRYRMRSAGRLTDDSLVAARYDSAAAARAAALRAAAFDSASGFFYDVRWRTAERVTDRPTMAAAVPLYFGLATPEQGRRVAERLGREFAAPGGFATTLVRSGQQWDAPNGWAPLQWMGVEGVRRYGRAGLADTVRGRWLALNRRTYAATGKMTEKYDVLDLSRPAGGGEYPTQDGFGWTNGVALAFSAQERGASQAAGAPR